MALPTPTFLGQVYTDTTSGRSWVCVSLTPPVWAVNKNVLLSIQGGLSVSGGASITGGLKIAGGLSVTGGATITGGVALYGTVTVNGSPISLSGAVGGSGIANVPLASASVTGVASFGNEFVVSALGAVSLTSNNVISVNGRTGNVVLPLASSSATGVASFGNEFTVSNAGAVGLTSNYVKSVNGMTGAVVSIATTGSNTFTGLQTLNAGLTTTHLHVTNGATFANGLNLLGVGGGYQTLSSDASNNLIVNSWNYQSYKVAGIEKLYIDAAGISATGLYVSTGATFANGLVVQAGGISITGGATLTGGVAIYGGLNVSSGTISGTLATAAQTNITSVGTLTRLEVGSGGISSAGGITGTLNTAAQPNITSVGTLTSLSSSGLVTASGGITSNHLYVSNGVTFAGTSVHTGLGTFNAGITSNHLYVTNGVTFASTSVHTGLGTFNAGITSNHLYVSNGATFAGTSVHTGLGTFNAGLTTTHLHVTNGATFAGTVSAGTISAALNGNASTATTLATARKINETSFDGSSDILINQVYREDNRIISPSEGSTGYSRFVFTAWNNNGNNAPYADGIHFRTYVDSSGGNDNLLMLRKDAIGMRLWQQAYGSASPYSVYKDVAFIQDVVTSFNGLTGAVSGVTTSAANTFTALNTFNAGLTTTHLHVTNGATFAGTVSATLNTAAQPNITSVGTLTSLSSSGLVTASGGITSNHLYVSTGVTFAGTNGIFLAMNASNPLGTTGSRLVSDSNASGALKITTPSGYVTIGPQNTGFSHFVTDIGKFYFNRPIQVNQASGQSTIGAYASDLPFTIGTPDNSNGTLITRIAVLTGPDSSIGGYVGIGTTTPQAKLDISGNAIVRGDLTVLGNIPYSFISVGGLTSPYRTTNFGSNVLNDYYAPLSVSGPIFVRGGTGPTNGTSYMLGRFVFDGGFDSNFSAGQTAAEFRGNVHFNVGNNRDSILFNLPNGGDYTRNNLRFTNPFTTMGMDVEWNGIRISSPEASGNVTIGTREYTEQINGVGGIGQVLPTSGLTYGAYALGTIRPGTGQTGYAFLHLLHGKTGPGTTSNAAIKIIRANNTQAFVDYAGRFNGAQFSIISDVALKSNIVKYTESTVSSVPIPTGKWLPDIRNFFQPYTFTYNNAPELGTKYGYLAQELASIDSKVAGSSFLSSEGNTGDSLTGTTNYFISQDQLLFGAVEAIRELDAEVCRLWKTSSAPPPSRAKDNDLWFDPTTSKMYLRFNDGTQSQWIQSS